MSGTVSSTARARQLREYFGLTQIELAHALGVSLRTVQNWDRDGV
jgi:DNA-binding transcriptional regulator YiaG